MSIFAKSDSVADVAFATRSLPSRETPCLRNSTISRLTAIIRCVFSSSIFIVSKSTLDLANSCSKRATSIL